jgi:hypothetical protein
MTGHLVIAELEAFRTVVETAGLGDAEKIKLWSRSAISNALHRAGPRPQLRDAAFRASARADLLAQTLGHMAGDRGSIGRVRRETSDALNDLISEVRAAGTAPP